MTVAIDDDSDSGFTLKPAQGVDGFVLKISHMSNSQMMVPLSLI